MNLNSDKDGFDFLNFDINTNQYSPMSQADQQAGLAPQQGTPQNQFDQLFVDDLDTFGLTPGISIKEEDESNDATTPSQFEPTNFLDLPQDPASHLQQQQQKQQQQQQQPQHLAPNSYQSANYASSYNNLSFNNNNGNNLTNLISPTEFSDFENSSYGSSFIHGDSLKSPPTMNSPTFSPSSLSSTTKNLSKEEKLRRRREFHNAVERRRRDLIKDRIKELGQLIPPSLLFDLQLNKDGKEVIKESRANKSIILNKTVEYILNLQNILASQDERLQYLEKTIEELGG